LYLFVGGFKDDFSDRNETPPAAVVYHIIERKSA